MSDWEEFAKDLNASPKLQQALGDAEVLFKVGTFAFDHYGAAVELLTWLGVLGEDDPFARIESRLDDIAEKLDAVFGALLDTASSHHATITRLDLNKDRADAHLALGVARDYLANPQVMQKLFDAFSHDAEVAANHMARVPEYWSRFDDPRIHYADPWHGTLTTADSLWNESLGPNVTWEYRQTLPALMHAIGVHFICVAASGAPVWNLRRDDMRELAMRALEVYDAIVRNIASMRAPSAQELLNVVSFFRDDAFRYIQSEDTATLDNDSHAPSHLKGEIISYDPLDPFLGNFFERIPGGAWRLAGHCYGAIELFTGISTTIEMFAGGSGTSERNLGGLTYPEKELRAASTLLRVIPPQASMERGGFGMSLTSSWKVEVLDPDEWQRFVFRFLQSHGLRTLRERKLLYSGLGLGSLARSISRMFYMLGDRAPARLNDYEGWSLCEVHSLIRLPNELGLAIPLPPQGITLRNVCNALLGKTAPSSWTLSFRKLSLLNDARM
jgi:hypothetical protein